MVPVIRNVEGMNFADIEKAINLLGEKVIFLNPLFRLVSYDSLLFRHLEAFSSFDVINCKYVLLQARKNELAVEDMDGGTFTISNGGVFGSMFGTPIINPPQSAILGMHGIFDRPVAIGGKVSLII